MRDAEDDSDRGHSNIPAEFMAGCAPRHRVSRNVWLRDIVRILSSRLLGMRIEQLEHALWQSRYPATPMPKNFRNVVENILSQHSSQSVVFHQKNRKPVDDLFFSPEGKGSGTWAVRHSRAEAWLKKRQGLAPHRVD
jgi:hypothetical protein